MAFSNMYIDVEAPAEDAPSAGDSYRDMLKDLNAIAKRKRADKDSGIAVKRTCIISSRIPEKQKQADILHQVQKFIQEELDDTSTPANQIQRAISKGRGEDAYKNKLRKTESIPFTAEQLDAFKILPASVPNYSGRTASLQLGFKMQKTPSNGYTTNDALFPAASINKGNRCHQNLWDLPQDKFIFMLGHHMMWYDLSGDEYLSYSMDPLFLIAHALNRYHNGQGNVTIQFIDGRCAVRATGDCAKFYRALDLYGIASLHEWNVWTRRHKGKLLPRKFTQEILSHSTVKVEDDRFQQVLIETLIEKGLFDLFPHFEVPPEWKRAGLYGGQVAYRKLGNPPPERKSRSRGKKDVYSYEQCSHQVPITEAVLELVENLAHTFMRNQDHKTHLHIFLCFLTFQKRPEYNSEFRKWIRERYTGKLDPTDVSDSCTS
jgi:hypothetical protein